MSREKSQAAFARAKQLMPGGVNSPARAFGGVGGEPIFFQRGEGAYLFDIDGNRYIDYIGSWGPMILGHAHPKVVAALEAALRRGTSFGAPTLAENELAELIVGALRSVEKVRLVNSGTEATMSAIRLARGYAGRPAIVKFAGNYHGHVDSLLVAAGSAAATLAVPDSPGVTEGTTQDTLILKYNDTAALESAFDEHGDRIAAVIVEPVAGSTGVLVPPKGYLEKLRAICDKHGILLIFDEVITGYGRLGHAFAAERYGVVPDMITFAKGITSGAVPMGGVIVRKGIYDAFMKGPEHVIELFHGYTYSAHPLACAAGLATLDIYRDEGLFERARKLEKSWGQAAMGLKGLPNVLDIRPVGLTVGIDLASRPDAVGKRGMDALDLGFFEHDVTFRAIGDTLALSPPLIVSESQIGEIFDKLGRIIKAVG